MIAIVAAMALDRAIGKDNKLLWHLPEDLNHFKQLTSGYTVIMGRKTFESLGSKPLPNRRNIVISSSKIFNSDMSHVEVVKSPEEAIELTKNEEKVFIIGGAIIYEQMIKYCDTLYITIVRNCFPDADTFFPYIGYEWKITEEVLTDEARYRTYSHI